MTRFSITGYSLGGLVARYTVGILYHRDFFKTIIPVNFTTIATPHLGLLRYPTWTSSLFNFLGPMFLARTGTQFYAKDTFGNTGKPLVEIMAGKRSVFFKGLASFSRVVIYGNGWVKPAFPCLHKLIHLPLKHKWPNSAICHGHIWTPRPICKLQWKEPRSVRQSHPHSKPVLTWFIDISKKAMNPYSNHGL